MRFLDLCNVDNIFLDNNIVDVG